MACVDKAEVEEGRHFLGVAFLLQGRSLKIKSQRNHFVTRGRLLKSTEGSGLLTEEVSCAFAASLLH